MCKIHKVYKYLLESNEKKTASIYLTSEILEGKCLTTSFMGGNVLAFCKSDILKFSISVYSVSKKTDYSAGII